MRKKRVFKNTIRNTINFTQWMILVCNNIIAMLCETLINIKIEQFELSLQASNYLFEVNNRNRRKSYEICSMLVIKTPERCQWRRVGVFIVSLEHISHLFLVFTVNFEQLVAAWNWTINVLLQWKLSKADTHEAKTRCPS